jgi:hypothetical protein
MLLSCEVSFRNCEDFQSAHVRLTLRGMRFLTFSIVVLFEEGSREVISPEVNRCIGVCDVLFP